MKLKRTLEETTNSSVYRKTLKLYLESIGEIKCSRCRMNKGCNRYAYTLQCNWKKFRKTQYKPVVYKNEDEKQIT
jgi:hypothetical protein